MRKLPQKVGWSILTAVSVLLFAALLLVALPFVGIAIGLMAAFDELFEWLKEVSPFKKEEAPR